MFQAAILTPWAGSQTPEDPARPKLADDYSISAWRDATGQPTENLLPAPNLYQVLAWLSEETLAAILSDEIYFVLWSKET